MANTRINSNRSQGSGKNSIAKLGIFAAILSALIFIFNRFTGSNIPTPTSSSESTSTNEFDFLPAGSHGQLVYNPYFALSYVDDYEQAEWVAYELTAENLNKNWVERADEFLPDDRIKGGSATLADYRNSGYDRGHLVPAADMAFSEEAMRYSFLLSNISPQAKNFNKGIWRELEEVTRNWAEQNKALYVVSGPVLSQSPKGEIGNGVAVPSAYFKILLDVTEPQQKGIGFIIPNEVSFEPLYKFAVSIDKVEAVTGFDFFPNLDAELLEKDFNLDLWEFSKKKFDLRVQKWNQQ